MMKIIIFFISLYLMSLTMKKYFFTMMINFMFLSMFTLIFESNYLNYYWMKINYIFGMDFISTALILLTFWIMSLSMLANNNFLSDKNSNKFINLMILLTIILTMCFCSMNLMIFYIFFETSLIPIMMIIMGWGYQIDRIQASMYMLFYTLFGSLPLLVMIILMYTSMNSLMFNIMWMVNLNIEKNFLIFILTNLAFLIKMPLYLTHLWLPKAHVEAPVSGSMILAGIMLKLGSYGMYRMIMISPSLFMNYNSYLIFFSMFGSMVASLVCLNQTDLKIMVAYSSVVHMSMLTASLLTLSKFGLTGSLMMMVAHGLCSSGMFFLVNCNYERIYSRNIIFNKGMINLFPSLTLWWFLIFSSNFSAPPSMNLFSEIMMINSMTQFSKFLTPLIMTILFFSTCYSIFMFAFSQYGKLKYTYNTPMISIREFFINLMLWTPLNFMFLNFNLFYFYKKMSPQYL